MANSMQMRTMIIGGIRLRITNLGGLKLGSTKDGTTGCCSSISSVAVRLPSWASRVSGPDAGLLSTLPRMVVVHTTGSLASTIAQLPPYFD